MEKIAKYSNKDAPRTEGYLQIAPCYDGGGLVTPSLGMFPPSGEDVIHWPIGPKENLGAQMLNVLSMTIPKIWSIKLKLFTTISWYHGGARKGFLGWLVQIHGPVMGELLQ